MASNPIYATRTVSGNQPVVRRDAEKATRTFLQGVPVEINAGYIDEWDGTTLAAGIAGISNEPASNLTSDGVAKTLTFGSVPNQSAAVNIPRGAPLNDGRVGYEVAAQDTVFHGQVGPSQLPVQTDIGVNYGMTKDSDGHWYVDRTKTGASAVVKIVGLDANDPRGVFFTFLAAAAQIAA